MIEAFLVEFPLKQISIAGHTFAKTTNLLLLKVTVQGRTGWGEAVPDAEITHDSPQDVIEYWRRNAGIIPSSLSLKKISLFHKQLPSGSATARAAMDIALHDLLARQQGVPVSQLYSPENNFPKNCLTIFGDSLAATKTATRNLLESYPALQAIKIKLLGFDDIERCQAIAEIVRMAKRKISFVLDCNQAYASTEAISVLQDISSFLNPVLIEEPVKAREWRELQKVSAALSCPVFADESAVTNEDVKIIIAKKCAGGINIKLQKVGGIFPAKQIAELCARSGLKVMVGCMLETTLGIAAGIQFSRCTPNVVLTDLDFDLQMPRITTENVHFKEAYRSLPEQPGLGVNVDEQRLNNLHDSGKIMMKKVL